MEDSEIAAVSCLSDLENYTVVLGSEHQAFKQLSRSYHQTLKIDSLPKYLAADRRPRQRI